VIEQKLEQVRQLINLGKERGYLLYDELNDMLARIIHEKRFRCNFPDLSAHSEHDVTNGKFGREETLILKHFGRRRT